MDTIGGSGSDAVNQAITEFIRTVADKYQLGVAQLATMWNYQMSRQDAGLLPLDLPELNDVQADEKSQASASDPPCPFSLLAEEACRMWVDMAKQARQPDDLVHDRLGQLAVACQLAATQDEPRPRKQRSGKPLPPLGVTTRSRAKKEAC
jgi:hypothetical protein